MQKIKVIFTMSSEEIFKYWIENEKITKNEDADDYIIGVCTDNFDEMETINSICLIIKYLLENGFDRENIEIPWNEYVNPGFLKGLWTPHGIDVESGCSHRIAKLFTEESRLHLTVNRFGF